MLNTRILRSVASASALFSVATAAMAHSGHGIEGPHWHATDTMGFVLVIALATIAIWLSRGD